MDCILPNAAAAIGNTPLVMLNRISAGLPGKIVKDRAAYWMIEDAEKRGLITPGKTVLIEKTSGNMGIALAFYAKMKGYNIVLLMPAGCSLERRALMLAFGAEVDMVCLGVGSAGTVTGVGKFLKQQNPEVGVYAVEPFESSVIAGFPPGEHTIQGIGAGFIPEILDKEMLTGIIRWLNDWQLRNRFWEESPRVQT
ncbi:hypothetical protein PMAYCL1PPCAC_21353 [Pristionchus mayeri]|uniref:Tryptophan synthase beta chain-like PALP domain-containing protein n=1 Tax=Pristionchus mayeri TaxID=1317129 RepID=A0AAN5CVA6_9BILA|nr:hypothetical protein PMAYCL1PPCAC_21350 [Pristionchus mayeri]GMR51158.1 hypothetical protein PMAYCL1PPCAC_21353 [Pristionchus mayeri]